MRVLVIDIGSSWTKFHVWAAADVRDDVLCSTGPADLVLGFSAKLRTDLASPRAFVEVLKQEMERCRASVPFEAVFVSSFGEGLIYEGVFYPPNYNTSPMKDGLGYEVTGTALDVERDIGSAFQTVSAIPDPRARVLALPVSTFVMNALVSPSVRGLDVWEWTHAANSGMYDNRYRRWAVKGMDRRVTSPGSVCGRTPEGELVFWGCHDHACVHLGRDVPVIIAGTWCVFSMPEVMFLPLESEKQDGVRWTIGADGRFHKQIVRKINYPISSEMKIWIVAALKRMGAKGRIRMIGGAAEAFCENFDPRPFSFALDANPTFYQSRMTARYALRCAGRIP